MKNRFFTNKESKLLIFLFSIITIDAIVTYILIKSGYFTEYNPYVQFVINKVGLGVAMSLKVITGLMFVAMLGWLPEKSEYVTTNQVATFTITAYLFLYIFLIRVAHT
jgi:hypothetical protein